MNKTTITAVLSLVMVSTSVQAFRIYPQESNEGSWNWRERDPLAQEVIRQQKLGDLFDFGGGNGGNGGNGGAGGLGIFVVDDVMNWNIAVNNIDQDGDGLVQNVDAFQDDTDQQALGEQIDGDVIGDVTASGTQTDTNDYSGTNNGNTTISDDDFITNNF